MYILIAPLDFQNFLRPCTRPHPTCTAIHIRYCQKLLQQRGLPSDEASECFSLSSIQRPEFFGVPNKWKGRNKSTKVTNSFQVMKPQNVLASVWSSVWNSLWFLISGKDAITVHQLSTKVTNSFQVMRHWDFLQEPQFDPSYSTDFFAVLNKWMGQNKSVSLGPLKCFSVSLI